MENPFEKQTALFVKEIEKYTQNLTKGMEAIINKKDVDIATSPKDLVFEEDKVKLYHFRSQKTIKCPVPLLITYALVNRETMMDLEEGRSLIRNLLDHGIDLYIISWGYPSRLDRYRTLDDYIDMYMDDCIDFVRKESGHEKINLMGVCQGGAFSAIYTSLYPEKILNLVTMVAGFDNDTDDSLLNIWARYMDVDLMVSTLGNIPGDFMNLGFLMLKPFQLMIDKYIGLVDRMDKKAIVENFLKMEKWIFDSPDMAGEAFRQFINELYIKNSLVKGELEINRKKVNLKNISMPVLNLYAEADHLVPPYSSKRLEDFISSKDYTSQSFPVGHIGMYVSSKAQKELAPLIANWITDRSTKPRKAEQPRKAKSRSQSKGKAKK